MVKDINGNKNPNWKGGKIIVEVKNTSYYKIHMPDHTNSNKKGYIFEHRFIMSELINRPLYNDEVVHHIDGNGLNNDPSNLMLDRVGKHSSHHNKISKIFSEEDIEEICTRYENGESSLEIAKDFSCSPQSILLRIKKCGITSRSQGYYAKKRKGRSKLTEEQWIMLYEDYKNKMPIVEIADKYSISRAMIPRGLKARGYKIKSNRWW